MKLSWKDIITTMLLIAGASVVYAKYYNYTWAIISSWRAAVAVLTLVAVGMFLFCRYDFRNSSILNVGEMSVGIVTLALALMGMLVTSSFLFYSVALMLGALWAVDTARHARHSLLESRGTLHPHAPVH